MRRLVYLPIVLVLGLLAACGGQTAATPTSAPVATGAPTATSAATTDAAATSAPATTTAAASSGSELTVFAAASLTEAFKEIGATFESANAGTTVTFNFAGSQQLAQQIGQGAPVDVFASANRAQMQNVIKSGQVISGTERTFVRNRLVVVTPKENTAEISALKDLAKPGIKLVFAAKAVPVGAYSLDFLGKASKLPEYTAAYSETVLQNVVSYEENVRSVLSKVALGEADGGIVYTSDISQDSAGKVNRIDIPDDLNVIASYPIATITNSPNAELAQKFVQYVVSPDAQQVLARYGFIPTND